MKSNLQQERDKLLKSSKVRRYLELEKALPNETSPTIDQLKINLIFRIILVTIATIILIYSSYFANLIILNKNGLEIISRFLQCLYYLFYLLQI